MKLVNINMEEFKEFIYPEYIKLFPKSERKTYKNIEKSVVLGITSIMKIVVEDLLVGFIIINTLDNNPYMQLDYLAILPKYQHKGYGTEAIIQLKQKYNNYNGIFIEIEKEGLGNTEQENKTRADRAKFYENLGFQKMRVDLYLFSVVYSAYILPCSPKINPEEVLESIFEIYRAIVGDKKVNKKCFIIKEDEIKSCR